MTNIKLTASQKLVIGYFIIIFIGALLLNTPAATNSGEKVGFLNAFFTAASAVCVTGLVVVDTGTFWTGFGHTVILTLIQIGGLGFMSIATMGVIISGKKIDLKERMLMQEASAADKLAGIVKFMKSIVVIAFLVEIIGAVLLSIAFVPEYGIIKGMGHGIFHSISAFCNAGFDLMGNFSSLTKYRDNYIINITVAMLVIIGGFGFSSLKNIQQNKWRFRKYNLHTKLVVIMTVSLIIFPTIVLYLIERNNPETLGSLPFDKQILASFFQVVSPRTAGFNTIDLTAMKNASKFLQVILMIIGGSPASTAGGLKTVTVAIIILAVINQIRGNEKIEVFNRTISYSILNKALIILLWCIFLITTGTLIIALTDNSLSFMEVLFEVASAYATVGLTLGITTKLTAVAKIVLILIMFSSRVGSLTILFALFSNSEPKRYSYPEENVNVG